jgi:hypothetical protein
MPRWSEKRTINSKHKMPKIINNYKKNQLDNVIGLNCRGLYKEDIKRKKIPIYIWKARQGWEDMSQKNITIGTQLIH